MCFSFVLGCGGSSEPVKHETPAERPSMPVEGGAADTGGSDRTEATQAPADS